MKKYLQSEDRNGCVFNMPKRIKFNIKCELEYSHFGNRTNMLGLSQFLNRVGENSNIKPMQTNIENILDTILTEYNKEYFWISIRGSIPNDMFRIPRWHRDGPYFKIITSKFITTLVGPPTLYIDDIDSINIYNTINKVEMEERKGKSFEEEIKIDAYYRPIYADKIKKYKQLGEEEGMILYPLGLIHSEPDITEPRLFLSILPGTFEQIEELKKRWNKY